MKNIFSLLFKHYLDFKSRATRKSFISFLFFWIIFIPLFFIVILALIFKNSLSTLFIILIFLLIYYSLTLIPFIAICIRRLHDIGWSALFVLCIFIPIILSRFFSGSFSTILNIISILFILILCFTKSEKGTNKWGRNPHGLTRDDKFII